MKKKDLFIKIIMVLVFALVLYYFYLPPINYHDFNFWFYLFIIFAFYKGLTFFKFNIDNIREFIIKGRVYNLKKKDYSIYIVIGIFLVIVLSNLVVSPLFNSKSYASRINLKKIKHIFEEKRA